MTNYGRIADCLVNGKRSIKKYHWLKQYYYFENILTLVILPAIISLELLLVYLTGMPRNIAEKSLFAFTLTLLTCDVTVFVLTLSRWRISGESCKVLAVLLHFFSLELSLFLFIIAYDICFKAR